MADNAQSKAAKKNAKRKAAKKMKSAKLSAASPHSDMATEDMLTILKEQLEKAKTDKDHEGAGKLRDQIWVLTDLMKGVKTDIDDNELLPILQSIADAKGDDPTAGGATAAPQPIPSNLTPEQKKIRNLKKKLQQIEALKERQAKGETLEKTQIEKLKSEEKLQDEIEELEDLLDEAMSNH